MFNGPIWLSDPKLDKLNQILETQSQLQLSYEASDLLTNNSSMKTTEYCMSVGTGLDAFEKAVLCLSQFAVHERAGFQVLKTSNSLEVNSCVLLKLSLFPFYITSVCRITNIISSSNTFGFTYGTLPHHIEVGEELFLIELTKTNNVLFKIKTISRPGNKFAILVKPYSNHLQLKFNNRYLLSMKELIARR
jgi:uncharacterized protein (UPF0548 family)